MKQHELFKTVRKLHFEGESWFSLHGKLTDRMIELGKKLQKMALFPGILFLLSYSVNFQAGEVGKFLGIPVAVPVSFALFMASLWCLSFAILSQSVWVVLLTRSEVAVRTSRQGKDADMVDFLMGRDDYASVQPIIVGSFFKTHGPLVSLQVAILCLGIFITLATFLPVIFFLANLQFNMLSAEIGVLEKCAVTFGLIALALALIFTFLFNFPSKVSKDAYQIRYGLLCRISDFSPHPQTERWMRDEGKI